MLPTLANFKNMPKVNNHPMGENSPDLVTLLVFNDTNKIQQPWLFKQTQSNDR
jgi:hypothetical protein